MDTLISPATFDNFATGGKHAPLPTCHRIFSFVSPVFPFAILFHIINFGEKMVDSVRKKVDLLVNFLASALNLDECGDMCYSGPPIPPSKCATVNPLRLGCATVDLP